MLIDSQNLGLLLVGHGTRDEAGALQFLELAERLKGYFAAVAVEAAFLELAKPGIDAGVERLLGRGAKEIVTAPVILFAAGHVKRDIPGQVAAAVAARGRDGVRQVQVGHLGCHEAVVELSRLRMEEAERGGASGWGVPREDTGNEEMAGRIHLTCLLLVARGSKDEEAAAEMHEFARLRQAAEPELKVEVAFLAMAQPSLEQQVAKLAASGFRRVVVQPHFLFEGELVERIRGQIAKTAAETPQIEWIVTRPLADPVGKPGLASELLAKVIHDRCWPAGFVLS
jgi:sirohydrochlorin cobaltochelatase